MRLRHDSPVVCASFDDPNLVSCAGLEPVMRLAQACDLSGIVAEKVCLPNSVGSNPAGKISAIVAGMVAGADSIDGLDVIRHGGMRSVFVGVYAPSTLGSFLREFTHGHARQVQSAGREVLVQLASRTSVLAGANQVMFVDVDSMLRRCYGRKKQGVAFGHAKVGGYDVRLRGYHPLIATLSTLEAAPVVAATRLRAGNAGSARGAASMVAEAIGTARACGAGELVVVRTRRLQHPTRARASCLLYRSYLRAANDIFLRHRYDNDHLTVPTRLVFGDDDFYVPRSYITGFEQHAPALDVEFVPGCGHFLPEERPDLATARLRDFLSA